MLVNVKKRNKNNERNVFQRSKKSRIRFWNVDCFCWVHTPQLAAIGFLISLVDNASLFSEYILKIDEEEGLLFTHQICTEEAVEVLSRDYGYSEEEAKEKVEMFLKDHNVDVIPRDRSNSDTVRWMFGKCKKAKIDFHPPDCFIIADFYKNGINKVYSNNNHFLDACRLFGMDTFKLRTDEKEIERQMKEIFRRRRK